MTDSRTTERPTPDEQWLAAAEKDETCPDGFKARIRQVFLEDYWPGELLAMALDYEDGNVPKEVEQKWFKDNPGEILAMVERTLVAGMVEPRVHLDPKPGQLGFRSLGRANALYLNRKITEFSGLTKKRDEGGRPVREDQQPGARAGDGLPDVREVAARGGEADPAAVAARAPVLESVGGPAAG